MVVVAVDFVEKLHLMDKVEYSDSDEKCKITEVRGSIRSNEPGFGSRLRFGR